MQVRKGDIIFLRESAYPEKNGNIQGGVRPLLVVSNNTGNHFSNIVIVCPLTTSSKRSDLFTHTRINHGNSTALCEQLFTINQSDITRICDHISEEEMKRVNFCLNISLGLI